MNQLSTFALKCGFIFLAMTSVSVAHAQKIKINTVNVLSRNADQVGCWLNTHESSNCVEFENILRSLKIKSMRMGWQYSVMDSLDPEVFHSSPCDPNVQSYISGGDCILDETITITETDSLLQNLGIDGFAVLSTDGINYTGTADKKLAAMSKTEREKFYIDNAVRWAKWAKNSRFKYFEIGNENDLPGEMVAKGVGKEWTGTEYGLIALKMAKAVKGIDPTIQCGINGGWKATEALRKLWWTDIKTAAPEINNYIDFVVVHNYAFGLSYSSWNGSTWIWGDIKDDIITSVKTLFPGKPIYVTEIGGFQVENNKIPHYRALVNIEMLSTVFLDPLIKHAQHWPDRWSNTGAIEKNSNQLSALGNGMAAYTQFAKPLLVANGSADKVTYNVAKDSTGNGLTLWLVNHKATSQVAEITLENYIAAGNNEIWTLTSPKDDPNAKNNELKREGVLNYKVSDGNTSFKISLNPTSASIITFDAKGAHSPQVYRAVTNTAGNELTVSFNQPVSSADNFAGFQLSSDGLPYTISETVISDKKTMLVLKLAEPINPGHEIKLNYVPGTVTGSDSVPLNSITNFVVVNNTKSRQNSPILESAVTNEWGNIVFLTFNKEMKQPVNTNDFQIIRDGVNAVVNGISLGDTKNQVKISLMATPHPDDLLTVSYSAKTGSSADGELLEPFHNIPASNLAQPLEPVQAVYGNTREPWPINDGSLIQAENYDQGGEGIAFHDTDPKKYDDPLNFRISDAVDIYECRDLNVNGYYVGNTSDEEWLEYTVTIEKGSYTIDARCASEMEEAEIKFMIDDVLITSIKVKNTGGKEIFETVKSTPFSLESDSKAVLKISFAKNVSLNLIQFNKSINTANTELSESGNIEIYPNPVNDVLYFNSKRSYPFKIYDITGQEVINQNENTGKVDVSKLKPGTYFLRLFTDERVVRTKFVKQ